MICKIKKATTGGSPASGPTRIALLNMGITMLYLTEARNVTIKDLATGIISDPSASGSAAVLLDLEILANKGSVKANMTDTSTSFAALVALKDYIAAEEQAGYTMEGAQVHAFAWIALGGVFVTVRLLSRLAVAGKFRRADWYVLGGYIFTIAYLAVCLLVTCEALYHVVTYVIKLAALVMFWDMIPREPGKLTNRQHPCFHRSILVVFTFTTALTIAALASVVFQCRPVDWWNHVPDAVCLPRLPLFISLETLVVFSNILVLTLPLKVVWKLNLQRQEKIIVTILLSVGSIFVFANVPRIISVSKLFYDPDTPWFSCATTQWVMMEFNGAIIALCLPATKALMVRCWPRLLGAVKNPRESLRLSLQLRLPAMSPQVVELTRDQQTCTGAETPGASAFSWAEVSKNVGLPVTSVDSAVGNNVEKCEEA